MPPFPVIAIFGKAIARLSIHKGRILMEFSDGKALADKIYSQSQKLQFCVVSLW